MTLCASCPSPASLWSSTDTSWAGPFPARVFPVGLREQLSTMASDWSSRARPLVQPGHPPYPLFLGWGSPPSATLLLRGTGSPEKRKHTHSFLCEHQPAVPCCLTQPSLRWGWVRTCPSQNFHQGCCSCSFFLHLLRKGKRRAEEMNITMS